MLSRVAVCACCIRSARSLCSHIEVLRSSAILITQHELGTLAFHHHSTPVMAAMFDHVAFPLDEKLYSLDTEESEFLKRWTGIEDDADLKDHILTMQRKAYSVAPYPCIRGFAFTK